MNGKALYELDLLRLQGNDPLYAASPEGLLKTLVDTYFLEQVILTEALKQDAARVRVSSAEVRQEVNRIREQFGLKDKAAYEQFLNQVGYTDAQLRAEVKTQLQIQKRLEQIRSGAKPTEEEVRFYYEVFKENYRTEPRVKARQIVVDDKALAEELAAKAKAGEDFAALARQHSKVGAEQGGALGAGPGEAEPKPVTQVVFPTEVGEAVFALKGPGVVGPIAAGGRYYIVKVEEYLPSTLPAFEEVKDRVAQDAERAKGNGVLGPTWKSSARRPRSASPRTTPTPTRTRPWPRSTRRRSSSARCSSPSSPTSRRWPWSSRAWGARRPVLPSPDPGEPH